MSSLRPGGLVLVHDFMVDDAHEAPDFAALYLLAAVLDNPQAECLTPAFVEGALRDAGFDIEGNGNDARRNHAASLGRAAPSGTLARRATAVHARVGDRFFGPLS